MSGPALNSSSHPPSGVALSGAGYVAPCVGTAFVWVACTVAALLFASCEGTGPEPDPYAGLTPHARYAKGLEDGGLAATALGRTWLREAERALAVPLTADMPFREIGYFDPAEPSAVAYRITPQRGQRVQIRVRSALPDSARLFSDLFRVPADTSRPLAHVASADSSGAITIDIARGTPYVLRLQPELLRGGRYTLTVETGPSLAVFPVAGADTRSIQSVFGAPREGGRREHHGVDIFVPRGTPVVAVAGAYVRRVGNGGLGGKTVWLRDGRGRSFYYAHLDSQLVHEGQRVEPGDTLGLVGNTGNARTTPPHLHFGLYQRGPVDPYPYLHQPRAALPVPQADTSRFGTYSRVAVAQANLRSGPSTGAPVRRQLPRHTALQLVGSIGPWHRVRLPDGTEGFLASRLLRRVDAPFRTTSLARAAVRHRPTRSAAVTDSIAGGPMGVQGRFEEFLLIERPGGRTGWVRDERG